MKYIKFMIIIAERKLVNFRIALTLILVEAFLLLTCAQAFAEETQKSDELQYCVDEHAVNERKRIQIERLFQRIEKFRTDKIPSNSVIVDVSELLNPIEGLATMSINLDMIRTKSYLRKEKLILIGDGFDDEELMKKAVELELSGFRDVKVLGKGRLAAALRKYKTSNVDVKNLGNISRVDSVTALSRAVSSSVSGEYVFVLPKDSNPFLKNLEAAHILLDDDDPNQFLKGVVNVLTDSMKKNKYVKLVLAIDNPQLEKFVLANKAAFAPNQVWFLNGGYQELVRARTHSIARPVRKRNYSLSCAST